MKTQKTPTQTGQGSQPQATELASKPRTRIPRRTWIVIRYDIRGGRPRTIAQFSTPTYAAIFRRALIDGNPTAELTFRIKEKTLL